MVSSLSPHTMHYYFTPFDFFAPASDGGLLLESLQISRTLLNILVDLNNAMVWIVSFLPLIYYHYYYYYYYYTPNFFRTSFSWWFLTGVTANLLNLQDSSQYSDRS